MDQVYSALRRLTLRLKEADIPYAIVGSMALAEHGYERATADIDVLMTREGLDAFKKQVLGLGYVETFPGSRGLRDTVADVAVDVLCSGDYPGDGKPKPVRFPDPANVAVRGRFGDVVPVPVLVELKLASGISAPHRLKDLADVLELIRAARLPVSLAESLDASVRDKYRELWQAAQQGGSN